MLKIKKILSPIVPKDSFLKTDKKRFFNLFQDLYEQVLLMLDLFTITQEKLISGVNIKTINGHSLLGEGNLEIEGGGGGVFVKDADGNIQVKGTENTFGDVSVDGVPNISLGNKNEVAKGGIAEGYKTKATGECSHAEGDYTHATGTSSHAEGSGNTTASGYASHAEGTASKAKGSRSHAEGYATQATASNSHAEGDQSIASADPSHAEGYKTKASGLASHSEGSNTIASGNHSHAEGGGTSAIGYCSHVEGEATQATGTCSHAEGSCTNADGKCSHAEGWYTKAMGTSSHAEGQYNVGFTNAIHETGIGTGDTARKNAFTIFENGDVKIINIGGHTGTEDDGKTLQEVINAKTETHVFATKSAADAYVLKESQNITVGTIFLIKDTSSADYFWNGTALQAIKVDMTGYAKSTDIPTKMSQLQNDANLVTKDTYNTVGFQIEYTDGTIELLQVKVEKIKESPVDETE